MRFGIALTTYHPEHWSQHDVFSHSVDFAKAAESLGFDDVWLLEHHFTKYGLCPSALMMAGYLLGATKRIKVGTAVTVVTLEHPVKLAEQVALLDQLGGGRFLAGFGRGVFGKDFEVFDVDPADTHAVMQEWIDIVLATFESGGEISWDSPLIKIPEVTVYPELLTRPRPPVYVVGESPSTIEWAASRGIPIMMNIPQSLEETRGKLDFYGEVATTHGHDVEAIKHVVSTVVHVSDSREAAERELLDNITEWRDEAFKVTLSRDELRRLPNYRFHATQLDNAALRGDRTARDLIQRALSISPVGTAQDCIETFEHLNAELGVEHFVCGFEGTLDRKMILESMGRFADEVMPQLADSGSPSLATG